MDLVGVQEVRWKGSGTLETGNYTLFYGESNANHQLGTFFFRRRIRSAVKGWTLSVAVFLVLR